MHNDALHLFPLADRFDRPFVSGAVGGVVAGLVVAGTSFAVFGVAAAVLVLPYLLTAAVSAVRRSAVAA